MPVTFQVVGNLADFGNDPRPGVRVRATATPRIKVSDTSVHSNEPETVLTDETGAFVLTLVSLPGVWYRIQTPYANAISTVNLAGYTPDVLDPTTGVAFPAATVINLLDVVDEDPTPGYDGIAYVGGEGGGDVTLAQLEAHAADTTSVHGITDTAALVVTTDPRLSDDRDPTAHAHPVADITATGTPDSTTYLRGDGSWSTPAGGGGGVTDHGALTGLIDDDHLQYALADGTRGAFAAPLGGDDNYVTDAEKAALHTHPAVIAQGATQTEARTAIGAGTSSFTGAYADLSGKPTLGTAAATAATAYATAAQGATADAALPAATAPELIRDTIGTALVAGDNITLTPNDGADTITIAASGGGGGGGGMLKPPPASGAYWLMSGDPAIAAGAVLMEICLQPVSVAFPVTLSALAMRFSTAPGGATVRVGLFASTTTGRPGAVLTQSTATVSGIGVLDIATPYTLQPGVLYWVAHSISTAGYQAWGPTTARGYSFGAVASLDTFNRSIYVTNPAGAAGAFSDLTGTTWLHSAVTYAGVYVKVA